MKKLMSIFTLILTCIVLCTPVYAANGTVSTFSANVNSDKGSITIEGTTSGVNAAVVVQVLDNNNIIAMESFVVKSNKFVDTLTGLSLTEGKTYTVRVADYDGGDWKTVEVKVPVTAPVNPPVSNPAPTPTQLQPQHRSLRQTQPQLQLQQRRQNLLWHQSQKMLLLV